jgi:hypothetical protein
MTRAYARCSFVRRLITLGYRMEKCRDCNSILTKQETACYACGCAVKRKTEGAGLANNMVRVINVLLVVSALLTLASLFFSFTPTFTKCAFATLVLGIVKSSATQMAEREGK